jgi:hypothetical protein
LLFDLRNKQLLFASSVTEMFIRISNNRNRGNRHTRTPVSSASSGISGKIRAAASPGRLPAQPTAGRPAGSLPPHLAPAPGQTPASARLFAPFSCVCTSLCNSAYAFFFALVLDPLLASAYIRSTLTAFLSRRKLLQFPLHLNPKLIAVASQQQSRTIGI